MTASDIFQDKFDPCQPPNCPDTDISVVLAAQCIDGIAYLDWSINEAYSRPFDVSTSINYVQWSTSNNFNINSSHLNPDSSENYTYHRYWELDGLDGSIFFRARVRINGSIYYSNTVELNMIECYGLPDQMIKVNWCDCNDLGDIPIESVTPVYLAYDAFRTHDLTLPRCFHNQVAGEPSFCWELPDNAYEILEPVPDVLDGVLLKQLPQSGYGSCYYCCIGNNCPSKEWTDIEDTSGEPHDRIAIFRITYTTYNVRDNITILIDYDPETCMGTPIWNSGCCGTCRDQNSDNCSSGNNKADCDKYICSDCGEGSGWYTNYSPCVDLHNPNGSTATQQCVKMDCILVRESWVINKTIGVRVNPNCDSGGGTVWKVAIDGPDGLLVCHTGYNNDWCAEIPEIPLGSSSSLSSSSNSSSSSRSSSSGSSESGCPGPYIVKEDVTVNSNFVTSNRKLARSSNGDLHTVYVRKIHAYAVFYLDQVCYAISTDEGENWDETILTTNYSDKRYPSTAIDSNDTIHIIWQDSPQIMYMNYSDPSQVIETLTSEGYNQEHPNMAIDSNDNIHIVWDGQHSGSTVYDQIRYMKYTSSSSSWGSIVNVTTNSTYCQQRPNIAVDSNDYLHVVWDGENSSSTMHQQIRYAKYDGSWQVIPTELTAAVFSQYRPMIAIDSNDYLHVVWQGYQGGYDQIRYKKYTSSWQSIVDLTTDGDYEQNGPSISIDGDDYVYIVWYGYTSDSTEQFVVRKKDYTSSWQDIVDLTDDEDNSQLYPNLIWANYPVINGARTNRPKKGFAFVWKDNSGIDIKYYISCDPLLEWDEEE